jgi:membrane protein DedA with SNARE-associated domain
MNEVGEFLICYGGPVLFASMFAEQLGLPIPATPVLLAAGALVGAGRMNWAVAISAAAIGSLLADFIWFYLGRLQGRRILTWLCRISPDPDAWSRRSEEMFSRFGMQGLIVAKFIPFLNVLMAPLAAIYNVPLRRFFALDVFGSLVYAGCFILLGFLFGDPLLRIAGVFGGFGQGVLLLGLSLGVGFGFSWIKQRCRQRV